jgi:prephenate dehydratase
VSKRVGYLGPQGSFNEQAAITYDGSAEIVPIASHSAVIAAVQEGKVDEGIAAIENSLDGSITETIDALLRNPNIYIRAEIVLPIEHNLIAAPGVKVENVQVVMSHPSALAQCRAFLESHLPNARLEAALSTAAAVMAAVQTTDTAGIGTRRAAELAGGRILFEGIQDVSQNKTRFVAMAKEDAPAGGDDKTSIAFTVAHDRPGTLMGVLRELSERRINLTRIESRPSREDLGIYIFLIDFQGHRTEPAVKEALAAVEAQSHYFRLLGSYPRSREAAG